MRERGIIVGSETIQQALQRVVKKLLDIDAELNGAYDEVFAHSVYQHINSGAICMGTPILSSIGRPDGVPSAASTVPEVAIINGELDFDHFYKTSYGVLYNAAGTGYDLSSVRLPAQTLSAMNDTLDRINNELVAKSRRPVACMGSIRATHPEILSFVQAKRHVDFSKWRFNISVFVTEELFERARDNQTWDLTDEKGRVVDTIDANELLRQIAICAHYCGEPGVLFKDRMEIDNATPQWPYHSTAPCAEIAMAPGDACEFSYINLGALVGGHGVFDYDRFGQAVQTLTRLLDAAVENTILYDSVQLMPLVKEKRRIGVGITGFADALVKMRIGYGSFEARTLAATVSEALDYHSKLVSVEMAKQRGPFPVFGESRYVDPAWVRRKVSRTTGIISKRRWDTLFDGLEIYGIRNASTTAMAPTGASSAIVGSSKSLEPIFSLTTPQGGVHASVREQLKLEDPNLARTLLKDPGAMVDGMLPQSICDRLPYLATARQLTTQDHIAIQQEFQTFLDESMAKTINLPQHSTPEEVLDTLWMAYYNNLKGLTVFRDNCLQERVVAY